MNQCTHTHSLSLRRLFFSMINLKGRAQLVKQMRKNWILLWITSEKEREREREREREGLKCMCYSLKHEMSSSNREVTWRSFFRLASLHSSWNPFTSLHDRWWGCGSWCSEKIVCLEAMLRGCKWRRHFFAFWLTSYKGFKVFQVLSLSLFLSTNGKEVRVKKK